LPSDVANLIISQLSEIKLMLNDQDDEVCTKPLEGRVNVHVGDRACVSLMFDYTSMLWGLLEKAIKEAGMNLVCNLHVEDAQHSGPYKISVTLELAICNNPNCHTLWAVAASGPIDVEFHPEAGAGANKLQIYRGDSIKNNEKQLAAKRKVLPYFFIGFRPAQGRGAVSNQYPVVGKKQKIMPRSPAASTEDYYHVAPAASGGLALLRGVHSRA
jgi:hypothetical protein